MSNTRARSNKRKEVRERRLPIGGSRLQLEIPEEWKEKGYHYHWVLDVNNRPARFLEYGYEFVRTDDIPGAGEARTSEHNADLGDNVTKISGSSNLVLMRIKEKWYKENQAAKALELDETDKQLMRGKKFAVENQYGNIRKG